MSTQNIQVVPVVPTFLQESGLSVFTAMTSPEFSIQVSTTAIYAQLPSHLTRGQGDDSQVLTLAVAPNQQVQAEPGAMCFAVQLNQPPGCRSNYHLRVVCSRTT